MAGTTMGGRPGHVAPMSHSPPECDRPRSQQCPYCDQAEICDDAPVPSIIRQSKIKNLLSSFRSVDSSSNPPLSISFVPFRPPPSSLCCLCYLLFKIGSPIP